MRYLSAMLLLLMMNVVAAQDLFMIRSQQAFPEAMTTLQEAITGKGYQISRVQRVDIGLTASGYKTDKYRIVFFGKLEEIRSVSSRHESLAAYIPLKIAIFAEGEQTILLASGFRHLRDYSTDTELLALLARWERDIADILEQVRITD